MTYILNEINTCSTLFNTKHSPVFTNTRWQTWPLYHILIFTFSKAQSRTITVQLQSPGKQILASASKNCIITWACCIWSYKGRIKMGQNGVECKCCSHWEGGGYLHYLSYLESSNNNKFHILQMLCKNVRSSAECWW